MTLAFSSILKKPAYPDDSQRTLDFLDTPELIANHGIQHVEVQQTHFISIGNFPDEEARASGLRAMYPLSSGSSYVHYAPARFNESPSQQVGISSRGPAISWFPCSDCRPAMPSRVR
jgi:hypothetical protein